MDKEDENDAIRMTATVATSPAWVPAAAAAGIVYGAGKGLDQANDFGKEHGPLIGVAAAPFIVIKNIVTGPFKGIKRVGEAISGTDK